MSKPHKAPIGRRTIKALVARGKWQLLGRIFRFKPIFIGTASGKPIIDWRCVPKEMSDVMRGDATIDVPITVINECHVWPLEKKAKVKLNLPGCPVVLSFRARSHRDQQGICHYCAKPTPIDKWTVDHRTPRSRGGNDGYDNKVGACRECNHLKANLTEEEFRTLDVAERKQRIRELHAQKAKLPA